MNLFYLAINDNFKMRLKANYSKRKTYFQNQKIFFAA